MLAESRIYSFIDQKEGFVLYFFEGQKVIHDLAIAQGVQGEGFHFFRDATLALQHLINFLKPGEGFGVYIDSENPYLRLKLEMSDQGQMRAILLPDDLQSLPRKLTGKIRTVKLVPGDKNPYTSLIQFIDNSFADIINKLLKESYQLDSAVYLSANSDQSLMISKLPDIDVNKVETNYRLKLNEYYFQKKKFIEEVFSRNLEEYSEIQAAFENESLNFLGTREIKFKCNCSRDRMISGLWAVIKSNGIENVFEDNESEITTKCDYCKTEYRIAKTEFLN